ncbi:hypothetical protein PQX77_001468 [Marasmius sp. AFHP31]|nr:hypothetical protein PQX77_001468 [Marasmius sp. AFHP31]
MFKIPSINGWTVILNERNLFHDVCRAPEEVLSASVTVEDFLKMKYTISPQFMTNPYHIQVVQGALNQNMGARLDDVGEELITAFDRLFPITDDWTEFPLHRNILQVIVRASNRLFVGLPLCRNPDYCDLNINFTISVFMNSMLIRLFPKVMHPLVGRIFTSRKTALRKAMKHLTPLIEQRLEKYRQYGKDYPDKSNDCIDWIIEANDKLGEPWQKGSIEDMILRMLFLNLAAVHTTSMACTHALFHLAANPHLIPALREEVETTVGRHGWNKITMGELRRLDSFLKESQRQAGTSGTGTLRVAMRDFTFSDGTVIPAGTQVALPSYFLLHDESRYPNPYTFDATRFLDKHISNGSKHQLVSPSLDYVIFGLGKHICPGRHFAVSMMKMMFAHVLTTYDIKFKDDSPCFPQPSYAMGALSADRNARIMLRKRVS